MTAWRGARVKKGKPRVQEHDIQAAFIAWCAAHEHKYPELYWFYAIINGAKLPFSKIVKNGKEVRICRQAGILKAEGLKPGPLDTHLPVARGGYHSLYIEFKAEGNDLTDEQRDFKAFAEAQGNCCLVCWSWEEAAALTIEYLEGRKKIRRALGGL